MSEINPNQPEIVKLLARIADALERLANNGQPVSPDMRRPIEEYAQFNWETIGATVVQRDPDGASLVEYGGFLWTRRSPSNKFDPAIWFSRSAGKDAEGNVNYLRLITFQTVKAPEALPDKARQVAHAPVAAPASVLATPAAASQAGGTVTQNVIKAALGLYYRRPAITEKQKNVIAPVMEAALAPGDMEAKRHLVLKALFDKSSLRDITIQEATSLWCYLKPYQDTGGAWLANHEAARQLNQLVAELDALNQPSLLGK